ncbi:hypothetical protein [Nostoc sp.]|uniref:hypothetical protein n=1 Tax=Nostoc sp. TaxID=1180 RepID=UPI002FF83555
MSVNQSFVETAIYRVFSDLEFSIKNLNRILLKPFLVILKSDAWGICATLSQEAKDKSDEKMDLADAVGADGNYCCR